MNYQDFRTIYLDRLKFIIQDVEFENLHKKLLISFEEKFELFNKSEVNFASFWFETLLDRFISVVEDTKLTLEFKIAEILDLFVELEIKSTEIEKDMNNIFQKIDYKKYGLE